MNTKLVMRYPSTWHQEMWREGAPFGNGLIGGMVYGGVYKENILINRALLWRGGRNDELPDVGHILPEIRRLLDERNIREADAVLTAELQRQGYESGSRPCDTGMVEGDGSLPGTGRLCRARGMVG